jgi:hypothetical protein
MTKRIGTLIAMLGLVGCAAGADGNLWGAYDVVVNTWSAADATPAMHAAAERWGRATGLTIAFGERGSRIIYAPWADVQAKHCSEGSHACTHSNGFIYIREDWRGQPEEEQVLVHELGHYMLMPAIPTRTLADVHAHHSIPGTMSAWWDSEDGTHAKITAELLEVVCSARPCSVMAAE